jgi:hypothetical protein
VLSENYSRFLPYTSVMVLSPVDLPAHPPAHLLLVP